MGPTTLFDKSFIQGLSLDEAVMFDHFFTGLVCPIFYVETLGDLAKTQSGRPGESLVRSIAEKFPEMHGSPCAFHADMAISELLGAVRVPMSGRQIPLSGGRAVRVGNETGFVFEASPEAKAFSRWQSQDFKGFEREFAKDWRVSVESLDLNRVGETFRKLGVDGRSCRSMVDAKKLAEEVVGGTQMPFERMLLALLLLNVPPALYQQISERWTAYGRPPLRSYAPYAAYVVTVEVFFQVCVAAHMIASTRPSNRIDVAYLYYLPFCRVFVSSDSLHRRCAEAFLQPDRDFIWGPDLKADLRELNRHFLETMTDEQREEGLIGARTISLPKDGVSISCQVWDHQIPGWRKQRDPIDPSKLPADKNEELIRRLNRMQAAPSLAPEDVNFGPGDADALQIQRMIRKKKGSWYQVPKDLPDEPT